MFTRDSEYEQHFHPEQQPQLPYPRQSSPQLRYS